MKNYILSLIMLAGFGLTITNAQTEEATAPVTVDMEAVEMAEKAALADASIDRKVCAQSGTVSYFQNSTCAHSGTVSAKPVQWDEGTASFVSLKSGKDSSTKGKKECSTMSKKECSKKEMKECSKKDKKACCSKKGGKKSCSKEAPSSESISQ